MIQLSEFFQFSFVLILKRKCLVGASRVRFGESGTPSTIIYRRWRSQRYELGYHAPMRQGHGQHIPCSIDSVFPLVFSLRQSVTTYAHQLAC